MTTEQLFNSFGFFVMQSWAPTFYLDYYNVDVGKIGFYSGKIGTHCLLTFDVR